MNGLIGFSMKRIAAMLIIMAMLFAGGLYSASSLKVENMPDVSFPIVFINTTYSAPPQDVMEEITKPIEEKISNIADLDAISSTSSDNVSTVIVQFAQEADVDQKKQELESLLQEVSLPDSASTPVASTFGFASIPAYYLSINADESITQTELNKLFEDEIEPGFESVDGIDHLDSIGVYETTLDILLDADAIAQFGLTPTGVSSTVQAALMNGAVGSVKFDGNTQMVRVEGEFDSLYNLENLEILTASGQTVLLKDLGEIQAISDSEFISRFNEQPSLGINLYKTSEANAVDFSGEVNDLIAKWELEQKGVSFEKLYDSADAVEESISGLLREGLIGIVLASLMILLFLRNIRMTLIVLISIPLSIFITLIMMNTMNLTLNIMTLGGMFIAVGRIVDDSIVVIENIYSHLERAQERKESVILLATKQVAMAISSSTFVTAGVFLPIAFVSGIIGGFFRPFALTVACALMASLLVALTVIPMLAKLMVLRSNKKGHSNEHEKGKVSSFYEQVLVWCLSNRVKTLLITAALFIVTLVATVPNLIINFISSSGEETQMNFNVKLPNDTSMETTDLQAQQIESLLLNAKDESGQPLFIFVQSLVGYNGSSDASNNEAQIVTEVNDEVDPALVKEQYTQLILSQLPQGSEVTASSLAGGGGDFQSSGFKYVLQGDDQELLVAAAGIVKEKLKEFPELTDVEDTLGDSKTEISITVSQPKAREFGISIAEVMQAVSSWTAKQQLGDIRFDNVLYTTTVELAEEDKNSMEQLGRMPIQTAKAGIVYLNEVANLEEVQAPVSLQRESQVQVVTISASIDSEDQTAISAKVTAALRELKLPEGVSTEVQGVSVDIAESFSQLFVAMGAAIGIVYLILVLCFGNAGTPFAILFSLPLAVIGGLIGLVVTKEALNITSMIGFMMLIGIVVTNAIVLLDRAQQLRAEGFSARHALVEAGMVRLRPIIMTAGATIVSMLPLALGLAGGAETLISKGLAVVVIGGLTTSTILTLVVVPVIYEMIESTKERVSRRFSGKPSKSIEA